MITSSIGVINPSGLHARVASQFCALAKRFQSEVTVRSNKQYISAHRILDLMAANIRQGQTIVLHCDGPDEDIALEELIKFIKDLQD